MFIFLCRCSTFCHSCEKKRVSVRKNDKMCHWPKCVGLHWLWVLVWTGREWHPSGQHRQVTNNKRHYLELLVQRDFLKVRRSFVIAVNVNGNLFSILGCNCKKVYSCWPFNQSINTQYKHILGQHLSSRDRY